MAKLTKRFIDTVEPPATGQIFVRDEALEGFALRVTANGVKAFIVEKRIHGRPRRWTVGRYGPLTLDQARDLAIKDIAKMAGGDDPVTERQQRKHGPTWHDLETLYLERRKAKKSISNDVGMFNKWLSDWRPRRLNTISRADICSRHADMGAAGHTTHANRMIALVRTMFFLAKDWGLYEGDNPASRIKFFKETKRDRFVTPDELPRLWKALQNEPNPYVRGAFFVGLLTGARRSEVLTMKWEHLDLRQGLWKIPDTKAGRPHYIPLPIPVINGIQKLPRLKDNPYVFCGRWGREHLINVSKPWRRIRKEAGLDDVRIHDLRRTLGSWMVAAGASLPLIGKALNHSRPETTQIYARLQLDPVRQALEANAEKMLAIVGGTHVDSNNQ